MVLSYVDADDVLRVGNRLVVLSPIEARIMRILLESVGTVVSRERINREIWPWKEPTDFGTLNGRVKLLRAHIAKLPLRIHTVRRRGLLLEVAPSSNRLAPDVTRALAEEVT
jgi:two-component system OmpR family response regulator